MKRIISIFLAVSVIALTFSVAYSGASVSASGDFSKSAWDFVSGINTGWNLGNTLDVAECWGGETGWGNPVTTQEMIDAVKQKGFNAIRIPVTWYGRTSVITETPDYKIHDSWMKRAKEVVDYAVKNDMYVVLNMHHDGDWLVPCKYKEDGYTWDEEAFQKVLEMYSAAWAQIANVFKDYNEKLIFESNNEVRDQENWSGYEDAYNGIARINQTFVDTVRATGGNNAKRYITVKAYASGGDVSLVRDFKLPNDPANHLIFDCHNYTSSFVSVDGTDNNATKIFDKEAFTTKMTKALEVLKKYFLDYGVPCFISEWGTTNIYNDEQRAIHAETFAELCGKYGVKCFWWDNGSGYGILYRQSCKWRDSIADAIIQQSNKYVGVTPQTSATMPLMTATPTTSTTTSATTVTTTQEPILYGDANDDGTVDIKDMLAIKKKVVGLGRINEKNADVNIDGECNLKDMLLIKKHLVGIHVKPWD